MVSRTKSSHKFDVTFFRFFVAPVRVQPPFGSFPTGSFYRFSLLPVFNTISALSPCAYVLSTLDENSAIGSAILNEQ